MAVKSNLGTRLVSDVLLVAHHIAKMTCYFVIVGHNDSPLFEMDFPPKSTESAKVNSLKNSITDGYVALPTGKGLCLCYEHVLAGLGRQTGVM